MPQAVNQLVEITETPNTSVKFPAEQPDEVSGYFTVGDLHAKFLSSYGGDPWQSYAADDRTSRDNVIKDNIKKIRSGEVVVISAGYNDTVSTNDTPAAIGARVKSIVQASVQLRHVISFLLFPITTKTSASAERQRDARQSIITNLNTLNNIRIIDLNSSQYTLAFDGQSLTKESYIAISNLLI